MKLRTKARIHAASIKWRIVETWDNLTNPNRKTDRDGFVLIDRYVIRAHFHGGPLDGSHADFTVEKHEQAGFGPFINIPNPDGPPALLRYERQNYDTDWYEAEGADTHIDLTYAGDHP